MTTNIDHARNSQVNYHNKKSQAPFTQYGPYSNISDALSANGALDNQFEVMSAGGIPMYKSPQTVQEFQYSKFGQIETSPNNNYGIQAKNENVPNYTKMKDKLNNIRKQNINSVTNEILSNKPAQNTKSHAMRTKSVVEDHISEQLQEQVI